MVLSNRRREHGNAVKLYKPNFDRYYNKYPTTQIEASGLDVGLPEGQMGNSKLVIWISVQDVSFIKV